MTTRVKPANWAFGEILTSAQMNTLDTNVTRGIDGVGGGDSSPSTIIGIKGSGLSVGRASGDDTAFVTGNAKWAGAAIDFIGGPTIALKLVDLANYADGRYVAVGNNANDKIAQSLDDGFSWVDISANIASPQSILLSCCAGKDGTLLAAGNNAKIYYTTDAATWAFITLGGSPTNFDRGSYAPSLDLFIFAGRTASAPYICSITSAVVGTQRTVPGSITGTGAARSIVRSSSGRIVVSWNGQTKVAYSDDGVNWTASTTSLTSGSYLIAYGDGTFVALDSSTGSNAYVSTDGSTWTTSGVTRPTTIGLQSFAALNGVFVALDANDGAYFSVDKGATWQFVALQYLGYSNSRVIKTQNRRLHSLQSNATNSVNMRSRRLGFRDGTG